VSAARLGRWAPALLLMATLAIGSPTPWVGAGVVLLAALCLAVGRPLAALAGLRGHGADDIDPDKAGGDALVGALVAAAFGVTTLLALATISAYLAGRTAPGAWLFAALGVALVPRWWRGRRQLAGLDFWLLVAALALALWHQLAQGVVRGDGLVFTDRWADYRYHQHIGNLVRRHGLPALGLMGWPAEPLMEVGHRGLPTLLAAVRDVLFVGSDDAARVLGIGGYVGLAGVGAALASTLRRAPWMRAAGAAAALLWSPLILWANAARAALDRGGATAAIGALTRPDPFVYHWRPDGLAAGAWHNLPQLWSTVLAGAALVVLGGWPRRMAARRVGLAGLLLAASGLVKPTLLVVIGPALLLALVQRRSGWRAWLALVAALSAVVAVWLLPAASGAAEPTGMTILPGRWGVVHGLFVFGLAVGAVIAAPLRQLRELPEALRGGVRWKAPDVLVVATVGAVLFAVLLTESDPARRAHGNAMWAMAAMLPLCAPVAIDAALEAVERGSAALRLAGGALLLVAALQLTTGLGPALSYPDANPRHHNAARVAAILEAMAGLPPETPALSEPALHLADLLPALDRVVVTKMAFDAAVKARWKAWDGLVRAVSQGRAPAAEGLAVLAGYRAVVLSADNIRLATWLAERGWHARAAPADAVIRIVTRPAR